MTQPFYTMRRLGVFLLLSAAILVVVLLFMPYRTDCGLPLTEAFQDSSSVRSREPPAGNRQVSGGPFQWLRDSTAYEPGSGLPGPEAAYLRVWGRT
jgi:hypothetical protein